MQTSSCSSKNTQFVHLSYTGLLCIRSGLLSYLYFKYTGGKDGIVCPPDTLLSHPSDSYSSKKIVDMQSKAQLYEYCLGCCCVLLTGCYQESRAGQQR